MQKQMHREVRPGGTEGGTERAHRVLTLQAAGSREGSPRRAAQETLLSRPQRGNGARGGSGSPARGGLQLRRVPVCPPVKQPHCVQRALSTPAEILRSCRTPRPRGRAACAGDADSSGVPGAPRPHRGHLHPCSRLHNAHPHPDPSTAAHPSPCFRSRRLWQRLPTSCPGIHIPPLLLTASRFYPGWRCSQLTVAPSFRVAAPARELPTGVIR